MTGLTSARAALGVALAALIALAGCQGGEKLIPVEGQVTVADEPLTSGTVVLRPDQARGNTSLHEPRGEIDSGGRYKVMTGSQTVGAPPGWYKVTVYATVKINPQDPYSAERFLTNKKYADPATSGLEFEVKAGAPPGTYDLKLGK
jgi:hypothetical protein